MSTSNKTGTTADTPLAITVQSHRSAIPLLVAIGILYAAFGIVLGLLQGGLPPLLRSRGFDIGSIGWLFAILLPFGLTFLWAPLVDSIPLSRKTPRVAWILAAQAVSIIVLLAIAATETVHPAILFGLALTVAFAAATMDVALDALSVTAVPPSYRPVAASLKLCALSLGAIIGGGVFVALSHRLGWQSLFLGFAVLMFFAPLPLVFNRDYDAPMSDIAPLRASLLVTLRRTGNGRQLALLAFTSCVLFALFSLNRIMLVDVKVPLAKIGWIVGTLTPLCGLAASAIAAPLLTRLGPQRSILAFAAISITSVGLMLFGLQTHVQAWCIVGTISVNGGVSGFYVVICATILGWARSQQPATDYAALFGISRLISTIFLIGLTQLLPFIGWSIFYVGAIVALLAAVLLLHRFRAEFTSQFVDEKRFVGQ
ncbi:MFS transporter [Paraburkholderia sp.]|uniref:MFS transporter n=1 Tax=Paraburkholderia sp. TaxID=1926495 RepID=UPI0039E3C816